jgi:hypothetical protein
MTPDTARTPPSSTSIVSSFESVSPRKVESQRGIVESKLEYINADYLIVQTRDASRIPLVMGGAEKNARNVQVSH